MSNDRTRWPYLVAAAVLLAVGAWLTSGEAPKPTRWPRVHMPRAPDAEDRERGKSRVGAAKAEPVQPSPVLVPVPGAPPPRPADPVLAALPREVKQVAMVVEANALRNSDLGDAMIACLTAGSPDALGRVRDAGFDPLTQLDRISLFDDTLMVTGDFSTLKFPDDTPAEAYGGATLHRRTRRNGEEEVSAVWRGQALLVGSAEEVKGAVDRLEGRVAPDEQPVLRDSDAYGEMYGVLKPDGFARMFDGTDPKLAELIRGAAQSVSLHVDAMHDVGMVADVKGADAQRVDELRRMMGGAVAAARARAMAQGKTEEADVLDLSRIMAPKPGSTSFTMELGVPYEMLKSQLQKCAEEGRRRNAEKSEKESPLPTRGEGQGEGTEQ